jgi:hypothetical protein
VGFCPGSSTASLGAFAFGLTDLAIGYEPSAGKNAENIETTIEPAIDADRLELDNTFD